MRLAGYELVWAKCEWKRECFSSKDTIVEFESRDWSYILGASMRNQKEVRDAVLSRSGSYQMVGAKSLLKVKEVQVGGTALYSLF